MLSSTFQPSSNNWPSDNIEELFKPGTIVTVVAAGDSAISSGREPCLFVYNVPASGSIIIGPVTLTMLPK